MKLYSFLFAFLAVALRAQTLIYSENFEATTGTAVPTGWHVQPGKFGESLANPLVSGINTSSRVLSFSAATADDDTYSAPFDLSPFKGSGQSVTLEFHFLSSSTSDHPGLIGLRYQIGSGPNFIAGAPAAQASVGLSTLFSGTGSWQQVTVDLSAYLSNQTELQLSTTYLYIEKWTGDAGQVSGANVYFDNIVVTAVPEPASTGLVASVIFAGIALRRGTRRTKQRIGVCRASG